jgi:hypothetical protein
MPPYVSLSLSLSLYKPPYVSSVKPPYVLKPPVK